MKFIWKGIPKTNHKFQEFKRTEAGKINNKVLKNTYIDDIIKKNTNKNYPIPGPGVHFLDERLIRRWHSKDKDIFKMPIKTSEQKQNLPRSKRVFGERLKDWVLGPDYRKNV